MSTAVSRQRAFALLYALLAVAAISLAASAAVLQYKKEAHREKERQLLWAGNQYRLALRSYNRVPVAGAQPQYPMHLEDLLEDKRGPVVQRHLRRLFPDPFTGQADWALEMEAGRIIGVHSRSELVPIGPGLAAGQGASLGAGTRYSDWRFLATEAMDAPIPGYNGGTASSQQLAANANGAPGASSAGGAPGGGGDGTASTPSADPGSPPPLPPQDYQCYAQYGAPALRCRGPSYPAGTDKLSCQRALADALAACLNGQ